MAGDSSIGIVSSSPLGPLTHPFRFLIFSLSLSLLYYFTLPITSDTYIQPTRECPPQSLLYSSCPVLQKWLDILVRSPRIELERTTARTFIATFHASMLSFRPILRVSFPSSISHRGRLLPSDTPATPALSITFLSAPPHHPSSYSFCMTHRVD